MLYCSLLTAYEMAVYLRKALKNNRKLNIFLGGFLGGLTGILIGIVVGIIGGGPTSILFKLLLCVPVCAIVGAALGGIWKKQNKFIRLIEILIVLILSSVLAIIAGFSTIYISLSLFQHNYWVKHGGQIIDHAGEAMFAAFLSFFFGAMAFAITFAVAFSWIYLWVWQYLTARLSFLPAPRQPTPGSHYKTGS
jgi:hypothetical protein